jgi:hypothetical protein
MLCAGGIIMAHRLRHTHSVDDITAEQAYGLGLLSFIIAVLGVAALIYVLL